MANKYSKRNPEENDAFWARGLEYLRQYLLQNGGKPPKPDYINADGFHLGRWMHNQRYKYKHGKLPPHKIKLLKIVAGWKTTLFDAKWLSAVNNLRQYYEEHGNLLIPHNYITPDGFKLGTWVIIQRNRKKYGKLTPKRALTLEKLPGWVDSVFDTAWQKGYAELKKYVKEFKDSKVPTRYKTPENYRLGLWVMLQRQNFRMGKLSEDKIMNLEKLRGWSWKLRHSPVW